ncbi:MAG: AAA family ATPase [Deltaproteobacteria bacterium]|nr:MAG: AAA family ATPase [Deltaproteobacteria bacterium]
MNLTNDARLALNLSVLDATERRHEFVGLEHLLGALLRNREVASLLSDLGVGLDALQASIEEVIDETQLPLPEGATERAAEPSLAFQRVINRALHHALGAGKDSVGASSLLVALFEEEDSHAVWLLRSRGVDRLRLVAALTDLEKPERVGEGNGGAVSARPGGGHPGGSETDPLAEYTVNLNEKARAGRIDRLVGRDDEIDRCVTILARRRKNNPLLVGESGVGKTAIAEGLALRIVEGSVPDALADTVIHSLDPGALLAGTRYRGDFEERLKGVLRALAELPGAVLFIDEIHNIVRMGAVEGGTMDASNLLKPALADGSLRCIGSTTFEEYRRHFEKDRALARRFQKVDVPEPSVDETVEILGGLRERYAEFHGVEYTDEALRVAARLAARRLPDRRLPDKAIDVIDEAGAIARLRRDPGSEKAPVVDRRAVESVVARMARIPEEEASTDDRERLARLGDELKAVVFGQDEAIATLVAAVRLNRAGLGDPDRPQGAYLFTGPTGVGKTEVARQLARTLALPLLRFDMSEYMERHAVSRLIGAPPGYVGHEQGGQLTEAVTQNPHCVLLLDEIEKAHPDVYNVLLQVMDSGRLTDNTGRTADFRHTILIMTSNVGARELATVRIGFSPELRMGSDEAAFQAAFSPEFRNRLDARVRFAPLQQEDLRSVVKKFLAELEEQLVERRVRLTAADDAIDQLALEGFDPVLGARPMGRVIRERIRRPLSEMLLFGPLAEGGSVRVELRQGEIVLVPAGDVEPDEAPIASDSEDSAFRNPEDGE